MDVTINFQIFENVERVNFWKAWSFLNSAALRGYDHGHRLGLTCPDVTLLPQWLTVAFRFLQEASTCVFMAQFGTCTELDHLLQVQTVK